MAVDHPESSVLAQHISTMTDRVDTLRSVEVNEFVTFFDSVIGRLLIADGQIERARACLDARTAIRRRQRDEFLQSPNCSVCVPAPTRAYDARAADIDAARISRAVRVPNFSNCAPRSTT